MKKVLIVVPSSGTGGVLSSLISLLNTDFVCRYKVEVFIMNAHGKQIDPILEKYDIGCNYWTSKVYSFLSKTQGFSRYVLLLYKTLFRIPLLGKKIIEYIELSTIKKLEKNIYDCVISFQERLAFPFVAKFTNPNKVAWIHCDYSRIFTNEDEEMATFSQYKKIVTVSKFTQQTLCKLLPQLSNKVCTIYNILDTAAVISKSKQSIDDDRFKTDKFTIISVGRISAVKQFEKIPLIAKNLISHGFAFRWYILGGCNELHSMGQLNDAIRDNNVEDIVICLGNKSNPYPYFKSADILVSTSKSEACPMIFNEAKILKLPIVTNNYGAAYEFIDQVCDGRICSIEQMADVISDIIQHNPNFCPRFSKDFKLEEIQRKIDSIIN